MNDTVKRYIELSIALREAKKRVLKEHDLNFSTWKKLRNEAESLIVGNIEEGGYVFVPVNHKVHILPQSEIHGFTINKRIEMHEKGN